MPEHSYPGVYVVEVESRVTPIEGVSTSTADLVGRDCIDRLRRLASGESADWTSQDGGDPAIAVLEALAYVADLLAARADLVADEAMLHSSRLAAASLSLASGAELPRGSAMKAVTFYEGQLLGAEHPARTPNERHHCLRIGKVTRAT